jgi:hypothetical protein
MTLRLRTVFPAFLAIVFAGSTVMVAQDSNSTSGANTSNPPAAASTPAPANQPAATAGSTSQQNPSSPANTPAATPQSSDSTAAPADTSSNSSSSSTEPQAQPKYKHNGGEDDIDAIGNRKVGGRGLGDWYSYEKEIAMGKQYAQQVEASVKLVQDPVVTEYINRIGQNLVRNSDAKVPFTIKVIDTDDINAMALPGGFFYVNSGLILAADNEAELAGVMAHEIAHVCARHATRQMTRGDWANIASLPLIFVGGGIGYAARAAASLAVPIGFMKFSRGFEAEADHLGIEYMYKTGYDPEAFVSMMEKMENLEKKKPGTIAKVFMSHPATPDRISASQKEIATILPPRESYILNTSEFDDVKARLAALENKHKIQDQKDANRPTLRRASVDNPDSNGKNPDDDRPVLKRRDDNPQ